MLRAVQFDCLEEALAALRLGTVRFRCCVCRGNHLSTSKAVWKCAEKMWRGLGGTVVRRSEEAGRLLARVASALFVFAPWLVMPGPPPAFVEMAPAEVASLAVAGEHLRVKQALAEFLKPAVASWREKAARAVREQEERYREAAAWFGKAACDIKAWFEFTVRSATVAGRTVVNRVDVAPRRRDLPDGVSAKGVNGCEWAHWASVQCRVPHPGQYLTGFRYGCRLLELELADGRGETVAMLTVPFQI